MTKYLADTNIWLSFIISTHQHREDVASWMAKQERESVFFCRSTQQSVLRLLTTQRVMTGYTDRSLTNQEAWLYMDQLLSDERVGWYDNEPPDLMRYWREYSDRATSSHLLWMDAYLAAFARAAGLTLVTLDKAFRQFPGLDVLILDES